MNSHLSAQEVIATRIVCLPNEHQLHVCMAYQIWGHKKDALQHWRPGDRLVFEVKTDDLGSQVAAVATVIGGTFFHNPSLIWEDNEYPYRISIKFDQYIPPSEREQCTEEVKLILREVEGANWGLLVQKQAPISREATDRLLASITRFPNLIDYALKKIGPLLVTTWNELHGTGDGESENPFGPEVESILNPKWLEKFQNPNPRCIRCSSKNTRLIYYGTLGAPPLHPEQGYEVWGASCIPNMTETFSTTVL